MDKKTFLEELRKSLRVLKEEELQDIIGEYEQHIDIKVKKGQTVEQAIADFGNVKELAAEILEAYHVRAEYSSSDGNDSETNKAEDTDHKGDSHHDMPEEPESNANTVTKAKINVFSMIYDWICRICKGIYCFLSMFWKWLWKCFSWLGRQVMRPFQWMKLKVTGWREQRAIRTSEQQADPGISSSETSTKMEPAKEIPNRNIHTESLIVRIGRNLYNTLKNLWDWMIRAALWCMYLFWNCCVGGVSLVIAGFGMMFLFTTGVLAVLWMQGYPLAGLTVGCFGLVLCLFAGAALGWTLLWRRSNEKNKQVIAETEEGQHA